MYDFPTLRLRLTDGFVQVGTNKKGAKCFENFTSVRISTTPDYIIFTPAHSTSGASVWRTGGFAGFSAQALKHRVALGTYRLYKYGNGFAIKRYERLGS